VFGRRCEIIDPKGEYGDLVEALDGIVLRLAPGGSTRLNPLTRIGTPEMRQSLLHAVAQAMLARALTQAEAVGVIEALAAADEHQDREVCVGDVVEQLRDPAERTTHALDLTHEAAREQLREVALALMRLCRGPLRGMFDAPTSDQDAWDVPVISLDISRVAAGGSSSDLALAITMVCATAFLDAQRTHRTLQAHAAGGEAEKTIRVNDEAWRALPIAGLGEYYQAAFKLGRQTGVQHWMVLHRLSDLNAAGDTGTRQQALAKGLLAETGTVIVYRQHPEEVPRATAALGLSSTESERISHYPQGVALWRIGGRSYAARMARGEVRIFDPTGCTRLPHTPWSPISAASSWEGARRTAARLLGIGENNPARSADESFWRPAGARYLAPLLLAAAHGELTMREVLSWTSTINEAEPTELLNHCPARGAKPALEALRSVWDADPRFRSSLLETVATALDAWQEPAIAAATMGEGRITASWLLDGNNTLYLISPAEDQRRLRGLFAALVAEITTGAFQRSTQTGRPIEPALLLALDEAANIAPLPNLDEIASTGPGQGVQLLTVLQNISQAADRWGRDRAETIIANHRARLFCPGIGDQATLEHLQRTLGEQEIPRLATHRQGALQPGSRTISSDFRALAPAHRVRQANPDTALLIYGRLPPAWLRLRPWYSHRGLRALAARQPPPSTTLRSATRLLRAGLRVLKPSRPAAR
jgi:hypothetical protein